MLVLPALPQFVVGTCPGGEKHRAFNYKPHLARWRQEPELGTKQSFFPEPFCSLQSPGHSHGPLKNSTLSPGLWDHVPLSAVCPGPSMRSTTIQNCLEVRSMSSPLLKAQWGLPCQVHSYADMLGGATRSSAELHSQTRYQNGKREKAAGRGLQV